MSGVLCLDQTYRPHAIISWQRAICLVLDDRAEVIEAHDDEIRSVSVAFKRPAVVRLLRFVARAKQGVKFSRINILVRDGYRCQYCAGKFAFGALTYDHVVPRSRGGKTVWENIVTACRACNGRKDSRTPEQAGMRLLRAPVRPASLPLTILRLDGGVPLDDKWASYLYWKGVLDQDS